MRFGILSFLDNSLESEALGQGGKKGMIVNWLIVLIIGSLVGTFTGLMLGGLVGDLYLAIIAGILATIIVGIVRNIRMPQLVTIYSTLAMGERVPFQVIIYAAIVSLAGSAAAVQVGAVSGLTSSVIIATLAGFFAGILTAILIIVYEMNPPPTGGASSP